MAHQRIAQRSVLLSTLVAALAIWLVGCSGTSLARSRARQPDVRPELPPGPRTGVLAAISYKRYVRPDAATRDDLTLGARRRAGRPSIRPGVSSTGRS